MGNFKGMLDLQAALLKRALGYEYEERRIVAGRDGTNERIEIIRKHVPPDVGAIKQVQLLQELGEWSEE